VNCRPHGGNLDAKFLDRISGQHETDSALDSYLNPEKFNLERLKGYRLFAHGVVKTFIVPKNLIARSSPMNSIGVNLKSFFKTDLNSIQSPQTFSKTQDLETAGGTVYLAHEDPNQLQQDVDFLRDIEKRAFQLVLSEELHDDKVIDNDGIFNGINSLINEIKPYGTSLLVTENVFDDLMVSQVSADEIDGIKGNFDCVVINLNESIACMKDEEIAKLFLAIFDKVKFGGLIFIPKTTYDFMPNARLGAEALLKVLDFKIELPIHKMNRMVIASKR
jgi:hypothetical protein